MAGKREWEKDALPWGWAAAAKGSMAAKAARGEDAEVAGRRVSYTQRVDGTCACAAAHLPRAFATSPCPPARPQRVPPIGCPAGVCRMEGSANSASAGPVAAA